MISGLSGRNYEDKLELRLDSLENRHATNISDYPVSVVWMM